MTKLDLSEGIKGALIAGAAFFAVVAVPILLIDPDHLWPLTWPATGGVPIFAAAGWITFAPRGLYRFVPSLGIVCAIAVCTRLIVKWAGWSPMRFGNKELENIYPSEAITLIAPSVITAVIFTFIRTRYSTPLAEHLP